MGNGCNCGYEPKDQENLDITKIQRWDIQTSKYDGKIIQIKRMQSAMRTFLAGRTSLKNIELKKKVSNSVCKNNLDKTVSSLEESDDNEMVKEITKTIGDYQFRGTEWDHDPETHEYKVRLELPNGLVYTGEVLKDTTVKDGQGVLRWADGSKYEGRFLNDKTNGHGRLIMTGGDVYEGEWQDDQMHGHGEYRHKNGSYYIGDWKNDKQNGFGKEFWPDGSHYAGYYSNGQSNGHGIFTSKNGDVYTGNFYQGIMEGDGTYEWKDGRKYEGEWKDNKMHGRGIFEWPEGKRYEGEYKNDIIEGFGELVWPDGRKYIGNWKNNRQHGKGTYVDKDGNTFDAIWKNGDVSQAEPDGSEDMKENSPIQVDLAVK